MLLADGLGKMSALVPLGEVIDGPTVPLVVVVAGAPVPLVNVIFKLKLPLVETTMGADVPLVVATVVIVIGFSDLQLIEAGFTNPIPQLNTNQQKTENSNTALPFLYRSATTPQKGALQNSIK